MWWHSTDLGPRRLNTYRLVFLASQTGLGKVVEIDRPNLTNAIEFALEDSYRRSVEIWENGAYACLIQRDPVTVEVA